MGKRLWCYNSTFNNLHKQMRRLYAFLLLLVGLSVVSQEAARAQSYAITDYLVRKMDVPDAQGLGSGPNWNPMTAGTQITSGLAGQYQGYFYYGSYGIQMPFNVRFLNTQITTTNTFSVD